MVEGMKEELRRRIGRTHWLSNSIKEKLMEKLDNLQTQIGYPDWYKDNAAVIRYYDGVFILTQLYNQKMHDICLYKPEILLFAVSNRNGLFSKYFKL